MRHRMLRGVAAAFLAVALAACSDSENDDVTKDMDSSSSSARTSTPDANGPTVTQVNGQPIIKFPKGNPPNGLKTTVLEKGTGAEIKASDIIVADYVGQVWGESKPFDSSFAKGAPMRSELSKLVSGWGKGLTGLHVGDKVILSIPPDEGYGPEGQPNAGIKGDDTIVFYIEIRDAISITEAGQADATAVVDLSTLPVKITGAIGKPVTGLEVKEGTTEPTEKTKTVIARGTGPEVGTAGTMYVAYYAVSMDGKVKETTWARGKGPQALSLGQGFVFDELVGTPVGSRVLLTVPKTAQGQNSASGSPAMFVIVDILAYYPGG